MSKRQRSDGLDGVEYRPDQNDIKKVAQAIIKEYMAVTKVKNLKDQTLVKMFYQIVELHQIEVENLKEIFQQQLLITQQQSMKRNEIDFIDRDDQLRRELGGKQLKVVERVIDLKNKKQMELSRLEQKYNLLLERFNKLQKQSKQKDAIIKNLTKENQRLKKIQTEFIIKTREFQQQINKLEEKIENAKIKMHQQKKLMEEYREYLKVSKQSLLIQTTKIMDQFARSNLKYILNIQNKMITMAKEYEQSKLAHQLEQEKMRKTLNQLINDLSKAVQFERKQNQSDQQWIVSYFQFKDTGGLQQYLNARLAKQTTSYSKSPYTEFITKSLQKYNQLRERTDK